MYVRLLSHISFNGTPLQRTLWDQKFLATFCYNNRGSPLSEVQNVFVTLVGTKIFVLTMEVNVFSNVFSFRWGYLHMNM